MFSTIGSTLPASRHNSTSKNYGAQATRGFSVHVFKSPAFSSFPYTATAKYDTNTRHPQPPIERQSRYAPRPETTTKPMPTPNEPSRTQYRQNSNAPPYETNNNPRTPSFSIYPGASKDTYVYERSVSSKSDFHATPDYDTNSLATFSPSSVFSPAMSTDSTLTLRSPSQAETSLEPPQSTSTPSQTRSTRSHSLSSQGESGQTSNMSPSTHTSSSRPSALSESEPAEAARLRASTPAVQGRGSAPGQTAGPSDLSSSAFPSLSDPRPAQYGGDAEDAESIISASEEDEEEEFDRISRMNTAYNASTTSSTAPFYSNRQASIPYQSSAAASQTPVPDSATVGIIRGPGESLYVPARQIYRDMPLRGSPEQEVTHLAAGEAALYFQGNSGNQSSQRTAQTTTPTTTYTREKDDTDYFIPPLGRDSDGESDSSSHSFRSESGPTPLAIRVPSETQGIIGGVPQLPIPTNPTPSRYTSPPSSDSSSSNSRSADRRLQQDRPLPVPPPGSRGPLAAETGSQIPDSRSGISFSENQTAQNQGGSPPLRRSPTTQHVAPTPDMNRYMNTSAKPLSYTRVRKDSFALGVGAKSNNYVPAYYPNEPIRQEPRSVPFPSSIPTNVQQQQQGGRTDSSRSNSPPGSGQPTYIDRNRTFSTSQNGMKANIPPPPPRFAAMRDQGLPRGFVPDERLQSSTSFPPSALHGGLMANPLLEPPRSQQNLRQDIPLQYQTTSAPQKSFQQNMGSLGRLPVSGNEYPINVSQVQPPLPPPTTAPRSHTPLPEQLNSTSTRPEPHRRHSDGEQSVSTDGGQSRSIRSEPHRRYSDGDQMPPPPGTNGRATSAPLTRSVRWNDNLICPSPITAGQRRKGWFNRRGDQLWTNDGAYRPAPAGHEFPLDLDGYPDYGEGWMNEECTRIDMGHRLIPKAPLRSALKPCRN